MTRSTLIVIGVVLASLVAGVWAGRTLLAPPAPLPPDQAFSTVKAMEGQVSRSIRLSARAAWSGGRDTPNLANGTVTGHRIKGAAAVKPGQAIYEVDLQPVSVAQGSVPAFRALTVGSTGADVRQLQQMLNSVGVRSASPDGVFGAQTASQVSQWQRKIGQKPTGQVPLGALVFLPKLPATVVLGKGLAVGVRVSATEQGSSTGNEDDNADAGSSTGAVIRALPAAPTFSISLPENQASMIRPGMKVDINHNNATWTAAIGAVGESNDEGAALATLKPVSPGAICAKACTSIPVDGASGLDSTVHIVPQVKGVVVPSAALMVGSDGSAAVKRADGTTMKVTVTASAGGRSVVDGVPVGTDVRVPGAESP